MQTFLPYGGDFEMNAFCLDAKRLGKQRVETYQILNAMHAKTGGWRNHPATKMWKPYPQALVYYGIFICQEWIDRGYNDSLLFRFESMLENQISRVVMPAWLDDERVYISHRSNLIRKFPEHYGRIWPDIPSHLPYFWPDESE